MSKDYVHNSLYNISKEMCKTDKENVDGTLENKTNSDIIPFQELGADSINVSTTEMRTSNDYETKSSRIFQITTTIRFSTTISTTNSFLLTTESVTTAKNATATIKNLGVEMIMGFSGAHLLPKFLIHYELSDNQKKLVFHSVLG